MVPRPLLQATFEEAGHLPLNTTCQTPRHKSCFLMEQLRGAHGIRQRVGPALQARQLTDLGSCYFSAFPETPADVALVWAGVGAFTFVEASIPTPALPLGLNPHPCSIPRPQSPPLLHP